MDNNMNRVDYEIRLKDGLSSGLDKLTTKASRLDGAMSKVGSSAQNTGSVFGGLMKMNIYGAIASGLQQLASFSIQAGVKLEQARISYQTMVGDIEKGNKLFAQTTEFANLTPFSTSGVQKAGRTLLAFGVQAEAVIPTLSVLGDVSAGTGKDLSELGVIYGQIKGAGRLMGQDLLQLINAGFNPLQQISKRTGESMGALKDRMSKGAISFKEVQQAFIDATSKGGLFYQMSEKQSKTLGGIWSTLVGKIENGIATFMESNSGFLKGIVGGFLDIVSFFETSFNGVKKVFSPLVNVFREAFSEVGKLFGEMGKGLTVTKVLEGLFNGLAYVIRFMLPVIRLSVNMFAQLFTGVIKLIGAFSMWYNESKNLQAFLKGFLSFVVGTYSFIYSFLTNIFEGISLIVTQLFNDISKNIMTSINWFKSLFVWVKGISNAFQEWYNKQDGLKKFVGAIVTAFDWVKEKAKEVFGGIGEIVGGLFSADQKQLKDGLAKLFSAVPQAVQEGKKAFDESMSTKSFNFFGKKEVKEQEKIGALSDYLDTTESTGKAGKGKKEASTSVDGVASGRPTTVNISIGKLIESFNITSNNIQDLENQVKQAVSKALLSAVNDVNLIV